ncbi:MAG TPA: hypothetical protein VKY65_10070 [Alphaproteobacteria bacterium]|nr:hypothetical protein [Alphaproteobacteria bacterium]
MLRLGVTRHQVAELPHEFDELLLMEELQGDSKILSLADDMPQGGRKFGDAQFHAGADLQRPVELAGRDLQIGASDRDVPKSALEYLARGEQRRRNLDLHTSTRKSSPLDCGHRNQPSSYPLFFPASDCNPMLPSMTTSGQDAMSLLPNINLSLTKIFGGFAGIPSD